jgi:hypothetical protein
MRTMFTSLCALLLIPEGLLAQAAPADKPSPDSWVNITDRPAAPFRHC